MEEWTRVGLKRRRDERAGSRGGRRGHGRRTRTFASGLTSHFSAFSSQVACVVLNGSRIRERPVCSEGMLRLPRQSSFLPSCTTSCANLSLSDWADPAPHLSRRISRGSLGMSSPSHTPLDCTLTPSFSLAGRHVRCAVLEPPTGLSWPTAVAHHRSTTQGSTAVERKAPRTRKG